MICSVKKLYKILLLDIFVLVCICEAKFEENQSRYGNVMKPDQHELLIRKKRQIQGGPGTMGLHILSS